MQFSIKTLLLTVVVISVVVTAVALQRESSRRKEETATLKAERDKYNYMHGFRVSELADARLGTSLLYRLAKADNLYSDLFEFLDSIPPDSLHCNVSEFTHSPSIRVVSFSQYRFLSDGSVLPIDQCKCAQLLVKSDSLEVVDYIMHYGFGDTGIDPPYTSDWILADGKHKMYYITESGFSVPD